MIWIKLEPKFCRLRKSLHACLFPEYGLSVTEEHHHYFKLPTSQAGTGREGSQHSSSECASRRVSIAVIKPYNQKQVRERV